jgi:hypothetical protein
MVFIQPKTICEMHNSESIFHYHSYPHPYLCPHLHLEILSLILLFAVSYSQKNFRWFDTIANNGMTIKVKKRFSSRKQTNGKVKQYSINSKHDLHTTIISAYLNYCCCHSRIWLLVLLSDHHHDRLIVVI